MSVETIWFPQMMAPADSARRLIAINGYRNWFTTADLTNGTWYVGEGELTQDITKAVDFAGSGPAGPQGSPGTDGTNGTNGANGTNGSTGATGPAGLGTVTPSTPGRAIGTAFQPNASKAVVCSYSVRTQVTNPLLAGSSTATVQLLSDSANPPTTERCRVEAISSVSLAVAIALTTTNTAPLSYVCPPSHFVKLVSTVAGTGATSIISQCEEALG